MKRKLESIKVVIIEYLQEDILHFFRFYEQILCATYMDTDSFDEAEFVMVHDITKKI